MTQDEMKKAAGWAALKYVVPGSIVGVGTGSTVNHFIDALATMKDEIKGAVSSSVASTERLKGFGIPVFDLNDVDTLSVYVDGADEINAMVAELNGADGIVGALKTLGDSATKPLVVRLDGNNVDEGRRILAEFNHPLVTVEATMDGAARKAAELAAK